MPAIVSRASFNCFEFIRILCDVSIQHGMNGGEFHPDFSSPVDGYISSCDLVKLTKSKIANLFTLKHKPKEPKGIVFEFHGYYFHGDERSDDPERFVHHKKKAKDVWEHDNKKLKKYYDNGYIVIVIYENDWEKIKKNILYKDKKKEIKEILSKYNFISQKQNAANARRLMSNPSHLQKISEGLSTDVHFKRNIHLKFSGTPNEQGRRQLKLIFCKSFKETLEEKYLNYCLSKKTISLKIRVNIALKIRDIVDKGVGNNESFTEIKKKADKIFKNEYQEQGGTLSSQRKTLDLDELQFQPINKEKDGHVGYNLKQMICGILLHKKTFFKPHGRMTRTKYNTSCGLPILFETEEECKKQLLLHARQKIIFTLWKELVAKRSRKCWRPFEEAREFIRTLKIPSVTEWEKWMKTGKLMGKKCELPPDIPRNPPAAYKDKWVTWTDWRRLEIKRVCARLGCEQGAPRGGRYATFCSSKCKCQYRRR